MEQRADPNGGPKAAIHSGLASALGFAVGTTIADRPPRRSVQAGLPHTAPPLDTSVEAHVGIRMESPWARKPPVKDRPQLFPIRLPPLTTTTQNASPVATKPFSESSERRQVARHRVVAVVAFHHPFQPRSDLRDRLVHLRRNSCLMAWSLALIRFVAVRRQTTK
jgi:hypothetical protein